MATPTPTWSHVRVYAVGGGLLATYPNTAFPLQPTVSAALDAEVRARLTIDNIAIPAGGVRLAYESVPTIDNQAFTQAYTLPGQLTLSGPITASSLHGNGQPLSGLVSNVYISGPNLVVQHSGEALTPVTVTTALPAEWFVSNGTLIHSGNVRVQGNLAVDGGITMVHTDQTTSEQLIVTNDGTGPALQVNQTGAQPVADFQDDGVSALYIEDGGFVGLGTTDPSERLEVVGNVRANALIVNSGAAATPAIWFAEENNTGLYRPAAGALGVVAAGTETLRLTAANLVVTGDITAFGSVSDERLKKDVRPLESGLAVVNALQPVEFAWNDRCFRVDRRGTADVGFIAQRVEEVAPLATSRFVLPGDTNSEYLSVKHERLIPYLVRAIQELADIVCKRT